MYSKCLLTVGLASALALSGCKDPTKDKPRAEVTNAIPAASGQAATPTRATETLALNPQNSKIEFVGSKVTGSHDGKLNEFTGTVQLNGDKPETSKIDISIDMASFETDTAKLTTHLKSADFFDVEKYPKATFTSTEITPGGAAGATHTIKGNLTLRGVTKGISFPATVAVKADEVTAKSEFSINRKDFNINYAGKADDLIKDQVLVKLDLRVPRKK
jgi:polyisoprenoid-binding protein YceI